MTNQQNERSNNGKRIVLIMLAILLIAAIAFGAYTYSKYVTSKEGTDSAKVAKWGFEVTINDSNNGFSTIYGTDGTSVPEEAAASAVVKGSSNVVAPGTNGNVISFSIDGTAEVDAKLTAALSSTKEVYLTLKKGNTEETVTYRPIVWTLKKDSDTAVEYETIADLATAVGQITADIKAGSSATTAGSYTIGWKWAFENADVNFGTGSVDADILDTFLGQIASETSPTLSDYSVEVGEDTWTVISDGYSVEVGFALSVSVEQTGITPGN